ncbi:MFS transporter [Adlercreutzia sp. ZJ242]|uniref:MFS transporter n=1 Tax=Adlercreutzia sp. ZJ242 TaxID=2709409 RepID=UPI0013ED35CC|nr:MFS transporter [Adlercreutzia sp. ZJ242]
MSTVNPGVYKAILRVRAAYPFDAGAFLMRFYVYMMNIGTVTMLTLAGYSFFTAGLATSAIALATFFISPRVSKLIDERGQSRVVPVAAAVTMVGLAIMLVDVSLRGPEWVLFAAAVLMGFVPSPQALPRARWTYLIRTGRLGDAAPDLRTMFSYEGVLDDIGFMFSPSISIALATAIAPVAGLLAGGIAFVAGTAVLTLSRSTEPEPGWTAKGAEGKDAAASDVGASAEGGEGEGAAASAALASDARHGSVIRTSPVVRVLFVLMMFVGAFYGVFDTATVSLAEDLGNPNIASVILVVASCVSMAMGFVFGMVNLRVPQHVQLVGCAVLIGCAYGTMCLIDSAETLFVVSTLAALFYAPFLIVANATCERAVPGDRLTEAITWMSAGSTCGMAFGPSIGGMIIDRFGTIASFDFGALLAIAIPVTALCCFRLIKRNVRPSAYVEVARKPVK